MTRYLPDIGESVIKAQLRQLSRAARILGVTAHDHLRIDPHRDNEELWSVGWYEY